MNFWAFLFLLIVLGWYGINGNSEMAKLARLFLLRLIERFSGKQVEAGDPREEPRI